MDGIYIDALPEGSRNVFSIMYIGDVEMVWLALKYI